MRSGCSIGGGRMRNPFTSENDTLVAAMPSASVATMTAVAAGRFACVRSANLRSAHSTCIAVDRLPVLDQVLGGPPRQRLRGQRRVARPARAHHRRAEDAEVGHLVREAEA